MCLFTVPHHLMTQMSYERLQNSWNKKKRRPAESVDAASSTHSVCVPLKLIHFIYQEFIFPHVTKSNPKYQRYFTSSLLPRVRIQFVFTRLHIQTLSRMQMRTGEEDFILVSYVFCKIFTQALVQSRM